MLTTSSLHPFLSVTMAAFVVFGFVPLFFYVLNTLPGVDISDSACFWVTLVLSVGCMFGLGALKGKLVELGQSWWYSGAVMAANGSFAAAIAYLVGFFVRHSLSAGYVEEYLFQ